jgi:hypothetical protein
MSDSKATNEALRKQAWDYFQMHSSQRLTTFNFYIVISSVVATALFSTFQKDYKVPALGILLGLLLLTFSYIFWKIDLRNRQLIKGAEAALKYFEGTAVLENNEGGEPHIAKIFQHEEYLTMKRKTKNSIWPWKSYYSYSNSLNRIFLGFALLGLIGAAIATLRFL